MQGSGDLFADLRRIRAGLLTQKRGAFRGLETG
jgi:hypothetical protein